MDTEDKEDRDKDTKFENLAHEFKASPGHPIPEVHKDQLEENRSYYWHGLVTAGVEHTSVALR